MAERTDIEVLAGRLTKPADPTTSMLIATITSIDTGNAGRVQTDITDLAWLPCDRDAQLSLGDRVWILKQAGVMLVCGRLIGPPSGTYVKRKTVATSVTSSATLVNDAELFVDLFPGTYRIELVVHASNLGAGNAGDIRSAWSNTGTITTFGRAVIGPGEASVSLTGSTTTAGSGMMRSTSHALTTSIVFGITDVSTAAIREDLEVVVSVAGRLQWRWAQGTSDATATMVTTPSRIYVTPLLVL